VVFERLRRLCERRGQPLAVAIIDFDRFKKINDELGHAMGDEVLVRSGQCIATTLRDTDHVGRWGGEELVAIMPDTALDGAMIALDKARRAVSAQVFEAADGRRLTATFSAGVVEVVRGASLDEAVKRADVPLYRAKQEGRDRVIAG
jgi:diguanylate cyclase (GGDEF)-like protein